MKKFIAPEMEVSNFNLSDILTASGNPAPAIKLTEAGAYNGTLPSDNGVNYVN